VLVAVPTLALADEFKREMDAALAEAWPGVLKSPLTVRVWRGRTQPLPEDGGKPEAAQRRMCAEPVELVNDTLATGADLQKALCQGCRFFADCRYQMQRSAVRRDGRATMLIVSHEHLFLPMPEGFTPATVIIDEELANVAKVEAVEPEHLTSDATWQGHPEHLAQFRCVGRSAGPSRLPASRGRWCDIPLAAGSLRRITHLEHRQAAKPFGIQVFAPPNVPGWHWLSP
jgi:hypothetical protein